MDWRVLSQHASLKLKHYTEVRAEVERRKLPAGEALRRLGLNFRRGRKLKVPWKTLLRDYDTLTGPDIPARVLYFVDELDELPTRVDRVGQQPDPPPLEPKEAIERIAKFYGYASSNAARDSLFRALRQAKTELQRTPEDRRLRARIDAVESRLPPSIW